MVLVVISDKDENYSVDSEERGDWVNNLKSILINRIVYTGVRVKVDLEVDLPLPFVIWLTMRSWGRPAKSTALVTRASFKTSKPLRTIQGFDPRYRL